MRQRTVCDHATGERHRCTPGIDDLDELGTAADRSGLDLVDAQHPTEDRDEGIRRYGVSFPGRASSGQTIDAVM